MHISWSCVLRRVGERNGEGFLCDLRRILKCRPAFTDGGGGNVVLHKSQVKGRHNDHLSGVMVEIYDESSRSPGALRVMFPHVSEGGDLPDTQVRMYESAGMNMYKAHT